MITRSLTLCTLAVLLLSGAVMAQPANDNCWDADIFMLTAGSSVERIGNNTGATDQGMGVAQVWEAFTVTQCIDLTISYCGTTPAFQAVHHPLYVGCNMGAAFDNVARHPGTGVEQTSCPDGNYTIPYFQLPAGTYYFMVESQAGSIGDYQITFTASACAATPPVNDECSGAITLVPNVTCVNVTGDVDGANAGVSIPAITCGGWTGDASDDVWFQFEATSTSHTIMVMPSAEFDATVDLRSGTCGSTVNIDCSEIGNTGQLEQIDATGLTIGETYYIRVYDWWSGLAPTTTFDICVVTVDGGDCDALSGALTGASAMVCLEDGEASLSATQTGITMVPAGFSTIYLLTMGEDLVIMQTSPTPEFTVTTSGDYTIHTLVYDDTTLDLTLIELGTTTGGEANALLIQGGGDICASLDLTGASFMVMECEPCDAEAGTLTAVIGQLCLIDGDATLEALVNEDAVIPDGFEQVFVLTQGTNMVVIDVSTTPIMDVTSFGMYTIHSLVFDPTTLNLNNIQLGVTNAAQVNALLQQGGGIICASLDLQGASYLVSDCTPSNDECTTAQGLNIYETGNCVGNEMEGTTIFSTDSGVEPACDPSNAGYADVWYIFNSGENTQVFIDVNSISLTSWGVAVYMDCGGGDLVACEAEPNAPMIVNTTEATDYVVMVYTNLQSGQTGEFTICLTAEEAVNFCLGGTVSTNMGDDQLVICTNDPIGAVTFVSAGVAAQNYAYILTNENGVIIDALVGNTMDFTDAPVGIYQVHGVSFNGMLEGMEEGELLDNLTSTGDCISISDNHVTVIVEICTGIESSSNSVDWSLYPNPTNGEINILYNGMPGVVQVQLTDMAGRMVSNQQLTFNHGERHLLQVNEALAPGMYNVTLTSTEGRSSLRLVVQ